MARVGILDVGQGNCTVIQTDDVAVVVDAGPGSALLEYLTDNGVDSVDTVLVSHADRDHIGGLVGLLAAGVVEIGKVRVNTDSMKDSKAWDDLLFTLDSLDAVDFSPALTTNDSGAFDAGSLGLEILFPTPYLAGKGPGSADREGRKLKANTLSAVVRVVCDGEPVVLLMGDVDPLGLVHLEESGADCTAPVVVFPHHGGDVGAERSDFINRVLRLTGAERFVFSMGREGRHVFPSPDIVGELLEQHPEARISCTQLSKHCSADAPASLHDYHGRVYSRGIDRRACCAGTVTLSVSDPVEYSPTDAEHLAFIEESVPTPMCRAAGTQ